jgi:hypothetical protein
MAYPRAYPFPRLPRTSSQSYKPTSVSASTCFPSKKHPTVSKDSNKIQSTTEPQNGDGSVARMSNADRPRSGLGLPMSDRLMDIGLVKQHAPSTSSQPSLAHPCHWIRSDTRRYTQQGASFQNSNCAPPTALAPPTSKSKHIPATVLRTLTIRHRLQKTALLGSGAQHRAPPSVRTFTSAANIHQTLVPSYMVVCSQHTQPTTTPPRNHATYPTLKPNLVDMSSNTNHPPTYKHMLLRDRPGHAPTADHHNLLSCHARRPLALLRDMVLCDNQVATQQCWSSSIVIVRL